MQRTATAEPPGEDITTWDLATILAEIDRHFTAALAADQSLKATPIAQFNDLLEAGNVPDTYRPTLYDFLAFDALSFYSSAEQAGARPQDAYDLTADGPIFGPWRISCSGSPRPRIPDPPHSRPSVCTRPC